jgi:pyrimidine-specific ribonucleoside hydrolase
MPIPVILDVDTGVDDGLALLFAARHPSLQLKAATCVAGNAEVDQVVTNTLTVLDAAGASGVPVARGAERPLIEAPRPARHVHGEDGLGDLAWPRPAAAPDARHAIDLLRDELLAAAGTGNRITLVALGPLTNIALLVRAYPHVMAGVERLVVMGGAASYGNATAAAEFNVWHDPEAAAIVLDAVGTSATPMTMYGLDVFYGPAATREDAELLCACSDSGSRLAGELLRFSLARYTTGTATIGDAGAVCAVADPDGLRTERLPVRVELAGTWTRGQTVVDRRTRQLDQENDAHGIAAAQVDVALGVDGARYVELWLSTVGAGSSIQSQSA